QTIAHFDREKRPIVAALLIDMSGSMALSQMRLARMVAKQIIESSREDDEIALFDVSGKAQLILGATSDKSLLLRSLDRFGIRKEQQPGPAEARGNGIHMHDTVCAGASYLREFPHSYQKVVAIMTDNLATPPNTCSHQQVNDL